MTKIKHVKVMAPKMYHILASSFFLLQLVILVKTEAQNANIEPHDNSEINSDTQLTRQNRALKLSEDLSEGADCPHCNIMNEMPMELAEKINEINDVDVFIHDFVEDTNSLSNFSSTFQHPASRKRRAAGEKLRQATCQPVDTVVSLVPPDERDPTVFYFPSCLLMKRCGGCCTHSGTSCTPTDQTEKQVTIKKSKYNGGSKLQALGDVTVTVKEHNKCRCQCKKTASDCNSLQKFISSQCRCECLNIQDAENCAKDPLKLFDPKSCNCVCRDTKECATGLQFDQNSCSCLPIPDDDDETHEFSYFGDHTYNETYEAAEEAKYDVVPATE